MRTSWRSHTSWGSAAQPAGLLLGLRPRRPAAKLSALGQSGNRLPPQCRRPYTPAISSLVAHRDQVPGVIGWSRAPQRLCQWTPAAPLSRSRASDSPADFHLFGTCRLLVSTLRGQSCLPPSCPGCEPAIQVAVKKVPSRLPSRLVPNSSIKTVRQARSARRRQFTRSCRTPKTSLPNTCDAGARIAANCMSLVLWPLVHQYGPCPSALPQSGHQRLRGFGTTGRTCNA